MFVPFKMTSFCSESRSKHLKQKICIITIDLKLFHTKIQNNFIYLLIMWTNKLSLFEDQTDLNNLPGIAYSLDLKITFLNLQTLAMLSVATILFGVDMF